MNYFRRFTAHDIFFICCLAFSFVIIALMEGWNFGGMAIGFAGMALILAIVGILFVVYFLPTFYAFARVRAGQLDSDTAWIIMFVNLVLGWTVIGWFGCLIFAAVARSLSR